jgi:hypothetical protein
MRKKYIFLIISFFLFISCGKDSPFTEEYWEDETPRIQELENETIETYNVNLTSIISDETLSGSAVLNLNLDKINFQANLLNVPTNIDIVRFSILPITCEEVRANGPPAPVSQNSYKNFNFTESGQRNDFLNSLNQGEIRNSNLVIYGLYGSNLSGQANLLFPLACGPLVEMAE